MKLLIKIYSNDKTILDDFNSKISNKSKTKISLVSDTNLSIPMSLNSDLNSYKWDIVVPIHKTYIPVQYFDDGIRDFYKENYPEFDGVLWLNDGEQKEINTLPVIGKNYYKEFGYIYNPSYNEKNFEKEFTDVLKLKNKYSYIENILFQKKNLLTDDDHIYNFRKKLNFCSTDITSKLQVTTPEIKYEEAFLNENTIIVPEMKYEEAFLNEKSILNDFVDQVYAINLERRVDRLDHITKEFHRIGTSFKRYNAIDGKTIGDNVRSSQIACLRSHVGVIKDAIDKGYKKIAVFEDDIIFCDDFEKRFDYYSFMVPDNWDIMYLGCHFNNCKLPTFAKSFIYYDQESYGCFAMILNNKNELFQKIIDITKEEIKSIDDYIHDNILKEFKAYVFMPFFVKTLNTISDISDDKNSYNYDTVDKHFKEVVQLPDISRLKNRPKPQPPPPPPVIIEHVKTHREICEDYLNGRFDFQVFHNGRVIFDSSLTDKINLRFFDNHFSLYGRNLSYQGMFIKRK